MTKIAIIGAGSVVFTRNLTSDILLVPALQDSTIALMDIDADGLELGRFIGAPFEQVCYKVAGANYQAWFLSFCCQIAKL